MRTHYERIIAVEDPSDVVEQAERERAARAACEREAARMQAEDEHSRKFRAALSEQQQAALRSLPASKTDSGESLDGLPRLHNEERATEADEALLEREVQLLRRRFRLQSGKLQGCMRKMSTAANSVPRDRMKATTSTLCLSTWKCCPSRISKQCRNISDV